MASCTPLELLHTPRVPELYLAVWTVPGAQDAPASRCSHAVALGGFPLDDDPTPPAPRSTAPSTKEVLDKLVDGDSMPIDLMLKFKAAVSAVTPGGGRRSPPSP